MQLNRESFYLYDSMENTTKHFDVIIMGAGLSGIGAAVHLQKSCPEKSYIILEGRQRMGGTWDLFKYPGIRSDSDMYTLGYNFKPWLNPKVIADGPSILEYINETAKEYKVDSKISYNTKIEKADWDSSKKIWTITCTDTQTKESKVFTCKYLQSCLGYYKYENGYTPEFNGIENFKGKLIHPQLWPEDFDYTDKEIVVIGSGATAITIVPAMSEKAKLVTMLQRSPTYVVSVPNRSLLPEKLNLKFPKFMYKVNRTIHIAISMIQYQLSRKKPEMMKNFFIKNVKKQVPEGFDVDKHFTPKYNPWDERLCVVPNGDLFKSIRKGKVNIVTDHIDTFDADGIILKSGEKLKADVIITATGLEVQLLGGVEIRIEGAVPDYNDAVVYKGMMIKDLPNFVFIVGYTNASWTLKADLASNYFCRLIKETEEKGKETFVATSDEKIETEPIIDFTSGYVQRAIKAGKLPRQGKKAPWKLKQNYLYDSYQLKLGKVNDGFVKFN